MRRNLTFVGFADADWSDQNEAEDGSPPIKRHKASRGKANGESDQTQERSYSPDDNNNTNKTSPQGKKNKQKRELSKGTVLVPGDESAGQESPRKKKLKETKKVPQSLDSSPNSSSIDTSQSASKKANDSGANPDSSPKKKKKRRSSGHDQSSPLSNGITEEMANDAPSSPKKGKIMSPKKNQVTEKVKETDEKEEVVKADIVVPHRRGKLKNLVQDSFVMEKPKVKVVAEDADEPVDIEGTSAQAQAMMKILSSTCEDDDVMEMVLSGGFIDSDDDTATSAKKKKKEQKQKRKSMPAVLPSQESNTTENSEELTNMKKKDKTKKAKRRSLGNTNELESNDKVATESKEKSSEKKKKGKKIGQGDLQPGEIEILVPNKKYTGKFKDAFQKEVEKSLQLNNLTTENTTVSSDASHQGAESGTPFASFEKLQKTPPAFVKRALAKASPGSGSAKKRGNSPKQVRLACCPSLSLSLSLSLTHTLFLSPP